MHELMRIKEDVCEEALKLTERGVNPRDLEPLYYMIEIMKGVLKIAVLEEELDGGYSQRRGYRTTDGMYPMDGGGYSERRDSRGRYSRDSGESYNSYDSGNSYARRGGHYVRGHYSRDEGMDHIKHEMERLADEAQDPKVRESIKRIMKQMDD